MAFVSYPALYNRVSGRFSTFEDDGRYRSGSRPALCVGMNSEFEHSARRTSTPGKGLHVRTAAVADGPDLDRTRVLGPPICGQPRPGL